VLSSFETSGEQPGFAGPLTWFRFNQNEETVVWPAGRLMIFSFSITPGSIIIRRFIPRIGGSKKGAPVMDRLNKFFDLTLRYALEPGLNWVLEHPIISVVVVVALVYWSVRGYRIM
jgi:hypothetical protein